MSRSGSDVSQGQQGDCVSMQGRMNTIENHSQPDIVWFEPDFSSICSVGKRPFWGTIKFEYRPQGQLLEFISVEEWITTLSSQELVIEDIARLAFEEASRVLGDIPLRITVSARTTVHAPVMAQISRGGW